AWGIWLDTEPLFRMDEGKKADVATTLVGGGVETPNEGRMRFNRPPLEGGDTGYMQQQDFPLDQVRKNKIVDAEQNPIQREPAADPEEVAANEEARQLRAELWQHKAIDATREAINA